MTLYRIRTLALLAGGLLVLGACGGSDHDDASPATGANPGTAVSVDPAGFVTKLNAGLAAMGTAAGNAVADLFDEKYLDMGAKKAEVVAALSAASQASATNPELSLFPMAQVTNAKLTDCQSDICTLNATLTNADADTTVVDFSTKVKVVNGALYLYGDQSATAPI